MALISSLMRREDDVAAGIDSSFNAKLKVEGWTLFSIALLLTILRLYATAVRAGGPKNWLLDEYLIILAFLFYIFLVGSLNVIASNGGANLFPPQQLATFTQEQIEKRILNSKIVVVSEQAMLNTIYVLKACLLVMYTRLTVGLRTQKAVRALSIYALIGWLATEISYFTMCMPFNQYWAIPPDNEQCATLEYYGVVQGVFNISSDMMMLSIPISIVVNLQVPWRKKLVLGLVLTMGIFVILAAIMCKIHNLSNVYSHNYMLWYIREASVALYVANMPMVWPILREWFPVLNRFGPSHSGRGGNGDSGIKHDTGLAGMPGSSSAGKTNAGMHGSRFGTVTTSVYHHKRRHSLHSISDTTDEMALQDMQKKKHRSMKGDNMGGAFDEERAIDLPKNGITVQQTVVIEKSSVKSMSMVDGLDFDFDGRPASKPRDHLNV
ncbi:hypothetical protein Cpir12675_005981 [Ceratocystis pirilliformis]|uniref:Rhodopsin domain-containing protein n=1 Tax=Ceratocystis pirilliformis TaxID=259994 RepID=A0ABR3YL46_9PEZI